MISTTISPRIMHGCFMGSTAMHEKLQALTRRVAVPYDARGFLHGDIVPTTMSNVDGEIKPVEFWSAHLEKIARNPGDIHNVMERSLFTNNKEDLAAHPQFIAVDATIPNSFITDISEFGKTYGHYLIHGLPFIAVTAISDPRPLVVYEGIERRYGQFTVDIGGQEFQPLSKMFDLNAVLEEDGTVPQSAVLERSGIDSGLLPNFFRQPLGEKLTFVLDAETTINGALGKGMISDVQANVLMVIRDEVFNGGAFTPLQRFMLAVEKMEEQKSAANDFLTGLYLRRIFNPMLEHEVQNSIRNKLTIALMYMDLNKFKQINDDMGHIAGDQVLVAVGQVLRDNLRVNDIIGRVGGDEFNVCFPNISEEELLSLTERIKTKLKESPLFPAINPAINGVEMAIGVSIIDFSNHDQVKLLREKMGSFGKSEADMLVHIADIMAYISKKTNTGQPTICWPQNIETEFNRHEELMAINGNARA